MSPSPQHLHLRVFLASPGDVGKERTAARELMEIALPKEPLLPGPVSFDVARFKTRPADCDIVLVILRARMGTVLDVASLKKPDGSPYLSGTEWEFEDDVERQPAARDHALSLCQCPSGSAQRSGPEGETVAVRQGRNLPVRFKNPDGSWSGGINDFTDATDFREKLATYLKQIIGSRAEALKNSYPPPLTPPIPAPSGKPPETVKRC
jgi:hypothetical protein